MMIRKMDELEVNVNQSSIKVSYFVTTLLLGVWSVWDIVNDNRKSLATILFAINILVLLISRLFFSKKYEMSKNITYTLIIIGIVLIMVAILIIGYLFSK